jgi:hypothetical protein
MVSQSSFTREMRLFDWTATKPDFFQDTLDKFQHTTESTLISIEQNFTNVNAYLTELLKTTEDYKITKQELEDRGFIGTVPIAKPTIPSGTVEIKSYNRLDHTKHFRIIWTKQKYIIGIVVTAAGTDHIPTLPNIQGAFSFTVDPDWILYDPLNKNFNIRVVFENVLGFSDPLILEAPRFYKPLVIEDVQRDDTDVQYINIFIKDFDKFRNIRWVAIFKTDDNGTSKYIGSTSYNGFKEGSGMCRAFGTYTDWEEQTYIHIVGVFSDIATDQYLAIDACETDRKFPVPPIAPPIPPLIF